ncbi:MAG: gluconate 2-dehydrogenase subunit 3 family protein [Acidobacteria bacterium]|nr:MAG: gluconate 2-dehydrogenase subunit 3 family protein [Acidobacteriota bacterium]
MKQIGYYPGYSTLAQKDFWDDATRAVVLKRLEPPAPLRFFGPGEAERLEAVVNQILPQDDRPAERRIAIVPELDKRLYEHRGPGYRYADMPPDGEAYRMGLRAIEEIAQHLFGAEFLYLRNRERDQVLFTLHDGEPPAAKAIFARMSVKHFWLMLVNDVAEVYYAHPWAWDEIGFGGPAYPRGYMRLERGEPEPWEKPEQRYEWAAPEDSLSGECRPLPGSHL